jgi:hypothetical protein
MAEGHNVIEEIARVKFLFFGAWLLSFLWMHRYLLDAYNADFEDYLLKQHYLSAVPQNHFLR